MVYLIVNKILRIVIADYGTKSNLEDITTKHNIYDSVQEISCTP